MPLLLLFLLCFIAFSFLSRIGIQPLLFTRHGCLPSCFPCCNLCCSFRALLLAEHGAESAKRLQLEWSAVLVASLTISTLPASYHFTLLILPVCLMWNVIQQHDSFAATSILLFLYLAIGYPGLQKIGAISGLAIFSTPRLYLVVLLCLFSYKLLAAQRGNLQLNHDTLLWCYIFVSFTIFNIASGLRHQHGLYVDYQWRIPSVGTMLQANNPVPQNDTVLFTAMLPGGYHSCVADQ